VRLFRGPKEDFMKKISAILILPVLAVAAAGCGSSSSSSSSSSSASTPAATSTTSAKGPKPVPTKLTISAATVPGLGVILVNAEGHTLYTFAPDKKSKVTCTSSCASVWPPVTLTAGAAPVAAKQVKASLLSSDANPSGGKVVTYAGWPLYTYVADSAPRTAAGQALKLNGGLWYVITPAGKVITKKP
jgi:predicted lipoprotein with Yx(FWY)xxD motif